MQSVYEREREFNNKRREKNIFEIEELDMKEAFENWKRDNYQIHIFDIDDCITKSFFPNIEEIADLEATKVKLNLSKFFFYFKIYYKSLPNDNSFVKVYFLTGRKAKDYKEETLKLLSELKVKEEQIIFYPDHYNHSRLRYFTFKLYNCLKIILKDKKKSKVFIYDDLPEYFPKLKKILKKLDYNNVSFYEIDDPIYWQFISDGV